MHNDKRLRVLCNSQEAEGPAVIKYVNMVGAAGRAGKTFALAFFGGILVFPVPLVHIFGVILILSSPLAALIVFFKSRGLIEGMSGSFDCPSCGGPNEMEYQEGKAPFYGSCEHCKNPYQVFPI